MRSLARAAAALVLVSAPCGAFAGGV